MIAPSGDLSDAGGLSLQLHELWDCVVLHIPSAELPFVIAAHCVNVIRVCGQKKNYLFSLIYEFKSVFVDPRCGGAMDPCDFLHKDS